MLVFQVCVDVAVLFNVLAVSVLWTLLKRMAIRKISFTYIFRVT